MSFNNKVHLTGYLGQDPKAIINNDSNFTALSVATTDSYQVKNGEEMIWKDNETVWHDILIFRPTASKFASELKKGDKVDISGKLSYRAFKDEQGKSRKQAVIVATYIEKIEQPRQARLFAKELDELVEKLTA